MTILKREVIKNPDINNLHANRKKGEGMPKENTNSKYGRKKEYLAEQDVLSTIFPDTS